MGYIHNLTILSNLSETDNTSDSGFEVDYTAEKATLFTILPCLSLMIIGINSFVLYLIFTRHSLRTATNVCLASLSCSDLLAGACAIPLVIVCTIQKTDLICLAMDLFSRFQAVSTVLHLLVISLERYITIVKRFKIDGVIRVKSIIKVLCIIWLFSLTLILIQLEWVSFPVSEMSRENIKALETYIICLVVLVAVCLLVILFVHGSVFYTLKRQIRHITRHTPHAELTKSSRKRRNKEFRAIVILSAMIITFIAGWCGYFVLSVKDDIQIPKWLDYPIFFARYLTALANPLLYTFFKLDFRESAMAVINKFRSERLVQRDRSSNNTTVTKDKSSRAVSI